MVLQVQIPSQQQHWGALYNRGTISTLTLFLSLLCIIYLIAVFVLILPVWKPCRKWWGKCDCPFWLSSQFYYFEGPSNTETQLIFENKKCAPNGQQCNNEFLMTFCLFFFGRRKALSRAKGRIFTQITYFKCKCKIWIIFVWLVFCFRPISEDELKNLREHRYADISNKQVLIDQKLQAEVLVFLMFSYFPVGPQFILLFHAWDLLLLILSFATFILFFSVW